MTKSKKLLSNLSEYFQTKDGFIRLLAILAGALFFAHELNIAIFVRLFEVLGITNEVAVTIASIIPFVLSIPLMIKKIKKMKIFLIIYLLIAVFFTISIMLNINYIDIYFRPRFGVHKVFLPSSGIFALYYILLTYEKDDHRDLIFMIGLSAFFLFTISGLQLLMARFRGYWQTESMTGEFIKINYSLIFGFNMALVVNLFLYLFLIKKNFLYLIFSIVGYYTILTDGNRMAMFLVFAFLILTLIHEIINYIRHERKLKSIFVTLVLILTFVGVIFGAFELQKRENAAEGIEDIIQDLQEKDSSIQETKTKVASNQLSQISKNGIYKEDGKLYYYEDNKKTYKGLFLLEDQLYYSLNDGSLVTDKRYRVTKTNDILIEGYYHFDEEGKLRKDLFEKDYQEALNESISKKQGVSRNLSLIGEKALLTSNARDRIYQIVIDGIKDSPVIGKGAYGDRVLLSPKYIWGHSHNIFLEVLVNFGLLFGLPILIYLLNTLLTMLSKKKNIISLLYFAFLGTGSLLLTSNSFWLEPHIWAIIGLSIIQMDKEDYWIYRLLNWKKNKIQETQ